MVLFKGQWAPGTSSTTELWVHKTRGGRLPASSRKQAGRRTSPYRLAPPALPRPARPLPPLLPPWRAAAAGIMRTRAPLPALLLRLGACHSPQRGGECGLRYTTARRSVCAPVTSRLGAGWWLCLRHHIRFSPAGSLVEPGFPWSQRDAPGARSAALRGWRQLRRSGRRGRVQ